MALTTTKIFKNLLHPQAVIAGEGMTLDGAEWFNVEKDGEAGSIRLPIMAPRATAFGFGGFQFHKKFKLLMLIVVVPHYIPDLPVFRLL